jgi:hypothetical protein
MATETTRDTIWLQKPRGIQYGCLTTRDTIWLQSHKGYNMAAAQREKQYGYRITREQYAVWLPKPRGIQYGCRNHEGYNMASETTRDTCQTTRETIWLPNHEGYNMAAAPRGIPYGCRTTRETIWPLSSVGTTKMFILPCMKLDEEEVECQELSQWLLSLGRLCCCLTGRHS